MADLPTWTLADLINRAKAEDDPSNVFNTGSKELDKLLGKDSNLPNTFGLKKGSVVEIAGPPGTGKTAIALSLALSALKRGHKVVWVSQLTAIPLSRLAQFSGFQRDQLGSLYHMSIKHPSQLLLLLQERQKELPEAGILVLDEIKFEKDQRVLYETFRRLAALARNRQMAIVLFNGMKPEYMYHSSYFISTLEHGQWDRFVDARVSLFRDGDDGGQSMLQAVNNRYGSGLVVGYEICRRGICDKEVGNSSNSISSSMDSRKRRRSEADDREALGFGSGTSTSTKRTHRSGPDLQPLSAPSQEPDEPDQGSLATTTTQEEIPDSQDGYPELG